MSKPALYINTIFRWCNDIDAMRHFYTDLFGFEESYYRNDEEQGWLTYQIATTQLVFTRASSTLPIEIEWAKAPAYPSGTKELESWVIAVNETNFKAITERLKNSDAIIYDGELETPQLLMLVRDPMGMTIEIWLENEEE